MEVSGQVHASVSLPEGERAPGTHWIVGWMGPRADLDELAKGRNPIIASAWNRTAVVQPVA
jgi:hypothetical protein